jgi:aryl-alcohol dehydrogenase-like predicted oxidoreductase
LLGGTAHRGGASGGASGGEGRRKDEKLAEHREKLERYEALCGEVGAEPAAVALAWLLHQQGVTAPIIGPRTIQQFEAALPAVELKLDEAALRKLDEIWPSPSGGKQAPESWAW